MSDWTAAQQAQTEAEYRLRFPNIPRGFTMHGLTDPAERDHLRNNVHDSGAWELEILRSEEATVLLTWTAKDGVGLFVDACMDEYAVGSPFVVALRRAFINIDEIRERKEVTRWGRTR